MPESSNLTLTLRRSAEGESLEIPEAFVRVLTGAGRTLEAKLGLVPVVVGSSPEATICVADPALSRRHCELRREGEVIVLKDLGSKNGTTVEGLRVRELELAPKLRAHLGTSQLWVDAGSGTQSVPLSSQPRFGDAIGASLVMRALFAQLERAAKSDASILLVGESGTGKDLLAEAVHANSPRASGPMVVVDCASLKPDLAESELFGHAKGAFTGAETAREGLFARADGGTILLDEVGELPRELQPRLLRVLEQRQIRPVGSSEYRAVDVRIIAATHRELLARVRAQEFREDLYYRLAGVELHVPALRERREDISLLAENFLAALTPPKKLSDLPPGTLQMLERHQWPGNVRELKHTVSRVALFPDLATELLKGSGADASATRRFAGLPLATARAMVVEQFERDYIKDALAAHAGNVSKTATALGLSRQFLHKIISRLGLHSLPD